jgi:peptide subunit release factor 1 (eRF1)
MAAPVTGHLGWLGPAAPEGTGAPLLAVVLDHAHARFYLVDASHAVELPCLVSTRMRGGKFHSDREDSPGWGEGGFHRRRREEERRHYAAVARRIAVLLRAHAARELLLAGTHPVVAALERALPPPLARLVVGTTQLNPTELTAAKVLVAAREARQGEHLSAQAQLVNAVLDGVGTGRAVNGTRDVLQALARDQVHTLLVGRKDGPAGYRCETSRRLVRSKVDAEGEAVLRIPDLVAAAVGETEQRGGTVTEISDPRQAARIDGLAALLRYR